MFGESLGVSGTLAAVAAGVTTHFAGLRRRNFGAAREERQARLAACRAARSAESQRLRRGGQAADQTPAAVETTQRSPLPRLR